MPKTLDQLDDRYMSTAELFTFELPRIVYGRGSANRLAENLTTAELRRPFLLTDRNLVNSGVVGHAINSLKEAGTPSVHIREPGEPTASEIDAIAGAADDTKGTAIIAIGGGASMDSAKCVRVLLELGGSIRDHTGEVNLSQPEVPLVAVPTTSGTGSETGVAALFVDDRSQQKTPVYSDRMRPDIAVCDPDLTLTVPPLITAATGADALAQAVGPFTSPLRQPITDALSQEAIHLIGHYLPRAVDRGRDVEARIGMAYGSLISGISMNNTEAMGDQFFDEVIGPIYSIPHGVVAGLVLPYVVQYNRATAEVRTALLADALVEKPAVSETERADQVVERLHRLSDEIGLPALKGARRRGGQAAGNRQANSSTLWRRHGHQSARDHRGSLHIDLRCALARTTTP